MRKTERIDQILIRLGHVTGADVEKAVARQKEHGGRIGSNLVEMGALTEEQLFDGLVEQFRVPTITVDEGSVPEELLDRMPKGALSESLIVPVAWNEKLGVLSLAVANPSDRAAIEDVRAAFGAKKVRISLAPEALLADLIIRLEGGEGGSRDRDTGVRLVALPELFEPETEEAAPIDSVTDAPDSTRRVLMVTSSAVRKNFLPAVFKPEGAELVVATNRDEVSEVMDAALDGVLVSSDMAEMFRGWIRSGALPTPECEITEFASVSQSLLDNPAPYSALAASVRASAQAVAEYRCAAEGVSPPYALMANDIELLADRVGLGRMAKDGLHVGLHFLMPVEAGTKIDPFRAFPGSMELAHRIRFPWPVDSLLSTCLGLYIGRADLGKVENAKEEVLLAAQALAIVWFRHNLAEVTAETPEEATTEFRTTMRELAGRLATLDVIESYLEAVAERGDDEAEAKERRVLLVGGERIQRAMGPALSRVGCEIVTATEVTEAQTAVEGNRPDAIVVDRNEFPADVEKVCRVLRVDRSALLFVLTDEADPALVLNLLDIGVDDVFGPPHEFDLVSARIHRAMRSRATTTPETGPEGQFSAKFEAFSFIDLTQMLANGFKSVRVDLKSGSGEDGVLFFEKGRPVHATCGALSGAQAVYYVVSWEDDGEFSVHDAEDFPDANIAESVESLLMEGVRLLDESRA